MFGNTIQIADTVSVAVGETSWINLVNNTTFPPCFAHMFVLFSFFRKFSVFSDSFHIFSGYYILFFIACNILLFICTILTFSLPVFDNYVLSFSCFPSLFRKIHQITIPGNPVYFSLFFICKEQLWFHTASEYLPHDVCSS